MLKKPNSKSFTSAAVNVVAFGVGSKLGDGLAAIMPESTNSYKSWILTAAGLVLAASINPSTTSGQAAQSAALGMAGSQLAKAVTEVITPSVEAKDNTTVTGKFINALVGHSTIDVTATPIAEQVKNALGMPWEPAVEVENMWERPAAQRNVRVSAA